MKAEDVYTIAGTGSSTESGDGAAANAAGIEVPLAVSLDFSGDILIADAQDNRARFVPTSSGTYYWKAMTADDIYSVSGNGNSSATTNGSLASNSAISGPSAVAFDQSGDALLGDTNYNAVWLVAAASGTFWNQVVTAENIYSIAGHGFGSTNDSGYSGDGSPAVQSALNQPTGLAVDGPGGVLFVDSNNNVIRYIPNSTGIHYGISMTAENIYTVVGNDSHRESGRLTSYE